MEAHQQGVLAVGGRRVPGHQHGALAAALDDHPLRGRPRTRQDAPRSFLRLRAPRDGLRLLLQRRYAYAKP